MKALTCRFLASADVAVSARDKGFSLIEMLVALAITGLIAGGLLTMLSGVQVVDADFADRGDAQQRARVAFDWLQRDLLRAGVGYADSVAVFPLIVPRNGGGIELRTNPTGFVSSLRSDFAEGQLRVRIDSTAGLTPGATVALTDGAGNIEIFTVDRITGAQFFFVTSPATRTFTVAEGGSAAALDQIEYWVDADDPERPLIREVNGEVTPVAVGVTAFTVTYFDDSAPPVSFDPNDVPAQLRIRAVEVTLQVESDADRLQGGPRPVFDYRTRIVPRVLALGGS